MKIQLLKDTASYKTFEIALDEKESDRFLKRATQALSRKHPIKGFRPGEVPLEVLEKHLDGELIERSIANETIQAVLPEFLQSQKLRFIGDPFIRFTQVKPQKPLVFEVSLAFWPLVELADHKAIQVQGKLPSVTNQEIDRALEYLKNARKANMLDDAFAQSLGAFKNMDELKQSIEEGLRHEKQQTFLRKKRDELLEAIRESSRIDIAPFIIDEEANKMITYELEEISRQGMTLENYFKQIGTTEKDFIERSKTIARKRLEYAFILHALAKKEGVEVTNEEVNDRLAAVLSRFPNPEEATKKFNPRTIKDEIRQRLMEEKVFTNILDKQIIISD